MGVEVAIAAAVISTVATAAGHAAQGKGQEAAYKYNADINDRNADASQIAADQLILAEELQIVKFENCLLYTSPSPRDGLLSRMPSSA